MARCVALLGVALVIAACGPADPSTGGAKPEMVRDYVPGCGQVGPGQPFASQEAYQIIKAAEDAGQVIVDDARAPVVTAPTDPVLDVHVPPHFRFTVPTLASSDATWPPRSSWWAGLFKALAPVGTAHAQSCPPAHGEIYLFRLWDHRAGKTNIASLDTPLYAALLARTDFIPTAMNWRDALRGRYTELNVEIVRAIFNQGQLVAGPYTSSQRSAFRTLPEEGGIDPTIPGQSGGF